MKKIRYLLIVLVFITMVLACFNVYADSYEICIFNSDKQVQFENKPFFYENSVYVPLRELAEELGVKNEILWNDGKITIYLDGHIDYYEIYIGKNEIHYDAVNHEINAKAIRNMVNPPILMNSTTYIPFEYIEAIFNRSNDYHNVYYIFNNIDSHMAYMDNAEGLTYSGICELQYSVDNGHFPWRLDPQEVIKSFYANDKLMSGGEISNFAGDGVKCAGTYSKNGVSYNFELCKLIRKDEYGIWIITSLGDYENFESSILNLEIWGNGGKITPSNDGWYNVDKNLTAYIYIEGPAPKSITAYYTDTGTEMEEYKTVVGRVEQPYVQMPVPIPINFEREPHGHLWFVLDYGTHQIQSQMYSVTTQKAYNVYYEKSNMFSNSDLDAAVDAIVEKFESFKGCELHSVYYVGDEECVKILKEYESLKKLGKGNYDEYIVFKSSFRSPKEPSGAWNPDTEYTNWGWYLGRNKGEQWKILTWGY